MSQTRPARASNLKPRVPIENSQNLDQSDLQALTMEPGRFEAEQSRVTHWRLKGTSGLAASLLLAGSLLLSGCDDTSSSDDCIPSTPPPGATSGGSAGSFGEATTPSPASDFGGISTTPTAPASAQFTSGASSGTTGQVYCRSRRTGGYYWFGGGGYYSSGGSSSGGSGASS